MKHRFSCNIFFNLPPEYPSLFSKRIKEFGDNFEKFTFIYPISIADRTFPMDNFSDKVKTSMSENPENYDTNIIDFHISQRLDFIKDFKGIDYSFATKLGKQINNDVVKDRFKRITFSNLRVFLHILVNVSPDAITNENKTNLVNWLNAIKSNTYNGINVSNNLFYHTFFIFPINKHTTKNPAGFNWIGNDEKLMELFIEHLASFQYSSVKDNTDFRFEAQKGQTNFSLAGVSSRFYDIEGTIENETINFISRFRTNLLQEKQYECKDEVSKIVKESFDIEKILNKSVIGGEFTSDVLKALYLDPIDWRIPNGDIDNYVKNLNDSLLNQAGYTRSQLLNDISKKIKTNIEDITKESFAKIEEIIDKKLTEPSETPFSTIRQFIIELQKQILDLQKQVSDGKIIEKWVNQKFNPPESYKSSFNFRRRTEALQTPLLQSINELYDICRKYPIKESLYLRIVYVVSIIAFIFIARGIAFALQDFIVGPNYVPTEGTDWALITLWVITFVATFGISVFGGWALTSLWMGQVKDTLQFRLYKVIYKMNRDTSKYLINLFQMKLNALYQMLAEKLRELDEDFYKGDKKNKMLFKDQTEMEKINLFKKQFESDIHRDSSQNLRTEFYQPFIITGKDYKYRQMDEKLSELIKELCPAIFDNWRTKLSKNNIDFWREIKNKVKDGFNYLINEDIAESILNNQNILQSLYSKSYPTHNFTMDSGKVNELDNNKKIKKILIADVERKEQNMEFIKREKGSKNIFTIIQYFININIDDLSIFNTLK